MSPLAESSEDLDGIGHSATKNHCFDLFIMTDHQTMANERHPTDINGDVALRGDVDADSEDAEEKARLICQVLELQNTLDGKNLSIRKRGIFL